MSLWLDPVGFAAPEVGQPELFCAWKRHNHSLLCLRAEKQCLAPLVFAERREVPKLVPMTRFKPRWLPNCSEQGFDSSCLSAAVCFDVLENVFKW